MHFLKYVSVFIAFSLRQMHNQQVGFAFFIYFFHFFFLSFCYSSVFSFINNVWMIYSIPFGIKIEKYRNVAINVWKKNIFSNLCDCSRVQTMIFDWVDCIFFSFLSHKCLSKFLLVCLLVSWDAIVCLVVTEACDVVNAAIIIIERESNAQCKQ